MEGEISRCVSTKAVRSNRMIPLLAPDLYGASGPFIFTKFVSALDDVKNMLQIPLSVEWGLIDCRRRIHFSNEHIYLWVLLGHMEILHLACANFGLDAGV